MKLKKNPTIHCGVLIVCMPRLILTWGEAAPDLAIKLPLGLP